MQGRKVSEYRLLPFIPPSGINGSFGFGSFSFLPGIRGLKRRIHGSGDAGMLLLSFFHIVIGNTAQRFLDSGF